MIDGKYVDVDIVKLRKFHNRFVRQFDITSESVTICGKRVSFEFRNMFYDAVSLLLPSHFSEMPENLAKLRYLSEHKPQLILAGNTLTENICLSLIDRNGRDLLNAVKIMRDAVLQSAPETVFYEMGKIVAANCDGHWFEYKSFTLTDEAYNMQFLFATEQKLLHVAFNCPMRDFEDWKRYMLKSFEYTKMFDRDESNVS